MKYRFLLCLAGLTLVSAVVLKVRPVAPFVLLEKGPVNVIAVGVRDGGTELPNVPDAFGRPTSWRSSMGGGTVVYANIPTGFELWPATGNNSGHMVRALAMVGREWSRLESVASFSDPRNIAVEIPRWFEKGKPVVLMFSCGKQATRICVNVALGSDLLFSADPSDVASVIAGGVRVSATSYRSVIVADGLPGIGTVVKAAIPSDPHFSWRIEKLTTLRPYGTEETRESSWGSVSPPLSPKHPYGVIEHAEVFADSYPALRIKGSLVRSNVTVDEAVFPKISFLDVGGNLLPALKGPLTVKSKMGRAITLVPVSPDPEKVGRSKYVGLGIKSDIPRTVESEFCINESDVFLKARSASGKQPNLTDYTLQWKPGSHALRLTIRTYESEVSYPFELNTKVRNVRVPTSKVALIGGDVVFRRPDQRRLALLK